MRNLMHKNACIEQKMPTFVLDFEKLVLLWNLFSG